MTFTAESIMMVRQIQLDILWLFLDNLRILKLIIKGDDEEKKSGQIGRSFFWLYEKMRFWDSAKIGNNLDDKNKKLYNTSIN